MYLFIYYSYTFLPRIVSSNKLLLMMVRLFLRNTYKGTDGNKNGSHSCSCCKKNEWKPTSTVIINFHHRRPLKIFVISWMFYLIHWYFYFQSPKWVIYTWSHVFAGKQWSRVTLLWIQQSGLDSISTAFINHSHPFLSYRNVKNSVFPDSRNQTLTMKNSGLFYINWFLFITASYFCHKSDKNNLWPCWKK